MTSAAPTLYSLLLAVVAVSNTEGDLATVRMEGVAPGTSREALSQAVENAKRAIIIDCTEVLAGTRDLTLFKPLLDRASHYIRSFDVRSKEQAEGRTTVEIEASVLYDRLRRDVARTLFPGWIAPPRVVVIVPEAISDGTSPPSANGVVAEEELAKLLRDGKLEVVVPAEMRKRHSASELREMIEGGNDRLANLARESLADVAIVATIANTTEKGAVSGNLIANRATIELRVILGEDGSVVDELRRESLVRSLNAVEGGVQAIRDACAKVKNDAVIACVLGVLGKVSDAGVLLTVEDLGDPARLDEIVATLKGGAGVGEVTAVYRSDAVARLRVAYEGPIARFVSLVEGAKFAGFHLKTDRVVGRDVSVRVVE